jgi:hypothetical protein
MSGDCVSEAARVFFRTMGGARVRGDGGTTVYFAQVREGDRLKPQVTCKTAGGSQRTEVLMPGQHLAVERAEVQALFSGEPLKISRPGNFDLYVFKVEDPSQPYFVLADAPILVGATSAVKLEPGKRVLVGSGTFGCFYWNSLRLAGSDLALSLAHPAEGGTLIGISLPQPAKDVELTYVCGGGEPVSAEVVSHNLSLLRGEEAFLARVCGMVQISSREPTQSLRLLGDPETGKLQRFVGYFEDHDTSWGVKFVQMRESGRMVQFSFYPKGKRFPDRLWAQMEAAVCFYNRYESFS